MPADKPVAENILLSEQQQRVGLKPVFNAQHDQTHRTGRCCFRFRPAIRIDDRRNPVISQHRAQPLARAGAVSSDQDLFSRLLAFLQIIAHRLVNIDVFLLALGPEIAAMAAARIDSRTPFRNLIGGEAACRKAGQNAVPFIWRKIERLWRQRFIARRTTCRARRHIAPRGIVIGDLLKPACHRFLRHMIKGDNRRIGQIIEQAIELFMKQRQPMFHPLIFAPGTDRFI